MRRMLYACSVAALLTSPPGALAQDRDRPRERDRTEEHDLTPDQDRTRLQIRDRLHTEDAVSETELAALDGEIAAYARRGGDPNEIRATVREALREGCKGACLAEAVRSMNAVMARGESAARARERVVAAVREQARAGAGASDAEKGAAIRERVEARERHRERARAHEQDRDRARERATTREPAGRGPR